MKTRVLLFALIAGFASASAIAADQILTFTNLGPVRIGMTQAEAEAALHAKLKPFYPEPTNGCWFGNRADGIDEAITYMLRSGKIVAIDVNDHVWPKPETTVPPVATARGIHVGASTADVKKAYASSPIIDKHYSDADFISLLSPDKQHGINFNVTTGKVSSITAGTAEDFAIVEPCL